MEYAVIEKPSAWRIRPNLTDYAAERETFNWETSLKELTDDPSHLNLAWLATDRHVERGDGNRVAIRWRGKKGHATDLTYADLTRESNKFAGVLRGLGVAKGDRVFMLAGRIPELYIAALGTLKNGSVLAPLFSAFGPDPIRQRMEIGRCHRSGDHRAALQEEGARHPRRPSVAPACDSD